VARLLEAAVGAPALRVVWDAGNGATGDVLRALVAGLPGEHHLINDAIDGRFPAHHPDPSVPENLTQLRDAVRARGAALGIAFDGDGDRIGVVDADGEIVWPDQLLLFLAQAVLRDQPGAPIVFDVKSSRVLADGIAAAGGRPVLSPSGYVLIRRRMLDARAPMSGEMSGHIFYADRWYGTDDALHVAIRLLGALADRDLGAFRRSLRETFATPELRLPCPDEAKPTVLDRVASELAAERAEVDRTDGLRVTEADGWWLLRASGTEPKLTARVEGWSEAARDRLEAALMERLRRAGWSA
jgi:phosphomannomutase